MSETTTETPTRRALLVVDVQNDFCEGGSLAVEGGLEVGRRISEHLTENAGRYDVVVASRDWHHPDTTNRGHFAAEGEDPDYVDTWPVHCVAGTPGAEYAPTFDTSGVTHHVQKGQDLPAYSMFEGVTADGTTLADLLDANGIDAVDVVGIATDYCVRATALDAVAGGREVTVFEDLVAAVAAATGAAAREELTAAGATWRAAQTDGENEETHR